MPEVFLIGRDSSREDYQDAFVSLGFGTRTFNSLEKAIQDFREKVDLIVIDRSFSAEASFKEFIKLTHLIPKLVVFESNIFKGFAAWTKDALVYPVHTPETKELLFIAKRLLTERRITIENEHLRSELSSSQHELNFFREASSLLVSSLKLGDVLSRIMDRIKVMTKAEAWSIFLLDRETGELVLEKTNGRKKKDIRKFRVKMGEGITGWVAREGIPLVVPDVSRDDRFVIRADEPMQLKTNSLMSLPIRIDGEILGVLELVNKSTGNPFCKEDLDLLMKLVDMTAISVERTSLHQKMTELAITDDLTKLFNTRYLNRTMEIEIQRSSRYNTSVSLIFMDIDHFKRINDQYGHITGSKVLVEMGQLLLKSLRSVDIVARYGGDEFVIVLPQTPPAAATKIAERMRKAVEQNSFLKKEGYSLRMTASFGVASYPESASSKEDLIRLADDAMYRVKYQTRNAVYAIV